MGEPLILETTFLIDFEREVLRSHPGPAHHFLEQRPSARLYITFTTAGEIAAGPSVDEKKRWEHFLAPFHVLLPTRDVCWRYGEIYRFLRENGRLIGTNDLWIAATALAHGFPLVTSNARHFRRVPDLEVLVPSP